MSSPWEGKSLCSPHEDNSSPPERKTSPEEGKLDPRVRMDLDFILRRNLKEIIAKYASYVDCLRMAIIDKQISTEDLRSYLLSLPAASFNSKLCLLSDKKSELQKCNSVTEIFNFLTTECASFLIYDIFQYILNHYGISDNHEMLKYPEHLKAYTEKHKISEFAEINPLPRKKSGYTELIVKYDIKTTCSLAKIVDLRLFIAEVMELNPSALEIVDIEDGCVIVTFLIPASIADALFTFNTEFTSQQEKKLSTNSVLWMKCNGGIYSFVNQQLTNPAVQKLKEQLTCSICHGTYTDPKQLQCQHAYCQQCLMGLVQQDQQGHPTLTCPTCRHDTPVPPSGVAGLQADFRANQLLEIVGEDWMEILADLNEAYEARIPSLLETIESTLTRLRARCDEISSQQVIVEEEIDSTIMMHDRKKELIFQLYQITETKLKDLAAQRDLIETIQAQLKTNRHSVREKITEEESPFIKIKNLLNAEKLEPKADITFVGHLTYSSTGEAYGMISAGPPPFKCQVQEETDVGRNAYACFEVLDVSNQSCMVPINSISSFLVHEKLSSITDCSMERIGLNKYKISYQPTLTGKHHLYITVEGHNIRGSPFPISVRPPELEVGRPYGVAVDKKGEIIVTSWDKYCVTIFSSSGERLLSFGKQGSEIGNFLHPHGVAVDDDGNILVADSVNHRIQKFTTRGSFVAAVGYKGSGPLQFNYPSGITINSSNQKIYVADEWNNRIQILNSNLSYWSGFGEKGNSKGQFNGPGHITCDSSGNVYVADSGNHRIQIFTAEGTFLRMFGRCGDGTGELDQPYGVAVDSNNKVYVSECGNRRVSVFTSEGLFLSYGRKGRELIKSPRGLAVENSDEVVYVCDFHNSCVVTV